MLLDRRKVVYGMLRSKLQRMFSHKDDQSSILSRIWETNDQAAFNYQPKPYHGKIIQFLPIKEYAHHIGPDLGWDKLANDGLEIHQLPFYPAGMLTEPFVQQLACKLRVCLEETLQPELHGVV